MKILNRAQQNECLVNLAVIQRRIMEALPLLAQATTYGDCTFFFDTTLDCLAEIAKMIDPDIGLEVLRVALDISESLNEEGKKEGKDDEQGDHDREPGE